MRLGQESDRSVSIFQFVACPQSCIEFKQRRAAFGWTNDIRSEFRTAYSEMLQAGVPQWTSRRAIRQAYKYFDSLGAF